MKGINRWFWWIVVRDEGLQGMPPLLVVFITGVTEKTISRVQLLLAEIEEPR